MGCTPAFGPKAAEELGSAMHPKHKLALVKLSLAGCPIEVGPCLES